MNVSDDNTKEITDNLEDYDFEEIMEEEDNDNEFINNSDTETDSVDSEDFYGASFEDAVNETFDDNNPQWPNEIYQEFAKILY